ncbi:MAG: molybdate ABC transporter substrate-binding protein [Alphaproteobacteria bacterium]|nr:molybdate ABC transporter substrate-binding protein [Alphaproteobacteria bacterium]MBV9694123.1 molybdate ABC transporter substrate-binding protein [Alphaproteobacteria bacterium]
MSLVPRIFAALALALLPLTAHAAEVTVFAAASLSDALTAAGDAYAAKGGGRAVFSFAASSTLARQIAASGGADIFISADRDWMDELDRKGLIDSASRKDLLGNRLVLVAPADLAIKLKIAPHFALAQAVGKGRLALADPASVPAGRYARAALSALGVWDAVADKLAPAENVRVALAYVARGEAPLGIVYATDAIADRRVRIVDTFAQSTHPPIVYPIALLKGANPAARTFLRFLEGPQAAAIFRKAGFSVLK